MRLEHDMRHMARALLEGVGLRFRSLLEVLIEVGLDVEQLVASGGFTQSGLWLQIMADVLGRELSVPVWGETSALAAAFWAALAAGRAGRMEDIRDWVQIDRVCRPVSSNAAVYGRIYSLYTRLYEATAGHFEEIARLQNELDAIMGERGQNGGY
jgi:gluconokinase